MRSRRLCRARGFSLLEVMVAIAILGLTLTVILSAQGGLAASNRSAANMGQAVTLGRCKMSETEEKLLRLGYQEIDQIDTDVPCCDDERNERFTCDLRVEKVELPNMGGGNALGDGGSMAGQDDPMNNPMAALNNAAGGAGLDLGTDAGLQGLGNQLQGQFGAAGGASGLLSMVMGMVYPSFQPLFEQSIRRISVTVRWKEGPNERELPLVQFVTNPQRAGFAGGMIGADGGPMDLGGTDPGSGGGGLGGGGLGGGGLGGGGLGGGGAR
jgi:general secretion pathway protein I